MNNRAISPTYQKLINNSPDPLQRLRESWHIDLGILEEAISSKLRPVQLRIYQILPVLQYFSENGKSIRLLSVAEGVGKRDLSTTFYGTAQ